MVVEQHEEWQVAERRYLSDGFMAELTAPLEPDPARIRRRLAS